MPEDAFVRMPFYGRRYKEVFDQRLRLAADSARANGRQMVSGRELGDIVARSHGMRCVRLSVTCTRLSGVLGWVTTLRK